MEFLLSNQEIEATKTFQNLQKAFQQLVLKLASKKVLSNGLLVYRTTKVIPGSVSGNNLLILKDLIEKEEKSHSS